MPFLIYNQVAIINNSTVISDADGTSMTLALNMILPVFCKDWNIPLVTAIYVGKAETIPEEAYRINLLDTALIESSPAYHDIIGDIPYANIYALSIIDSSGAILYEPTCKTRTVAQAVCHEVLELLIDPMCTLWWININTGVLYAGEVVDPVDLNAVVVNVGPVKVAMCDWILPAWQNIKSKSGPYNHLNTLKEPFDIEDNGYVMYINSSPVNYAFGNIATHEMRAHYPVKHRNKVRVNTVNL